MEHHEVTTPEAPPTVSSLSVRIMNVFSSPAELGEELRMTPVQTSSWLVPLLVSLVLIFLFSFALYENPVLRQQIFDLQAEGMRKAVEEGRMTASQADRVRDQMNDVGAGMFVLFGGISRSVFLAAAFFGAALFLWLASKFIMKSGATYTKMLEVYGLSNWIGIVGAIVTLLLMYVFDSLSAGPNVAIFMGESFDRANNAHAFLHALDVFTIWQTAVVGLALSKIAQRPVGLGMGVAYGLWLVWVVIMIALGWGAM